MSSHNHDKAKREKKKKEIKRFLRAELKKEIKPLFVGSVAMVCSALSNQGENIFILLYVSCSHSPFPCILLCLTMAPMLLSKLKNLLLFLLLFIFNNHACIFLSI